MGHFLAIFTRKSTWCFVFLLLLGAGAASYLIPREIVQLNWEVPGDPADYPLVYQARPWLIGVACFIPSFISLLYCFIGIIDRYMTLSILTTFSLTTGVIFLIWLLGDFSDNVSDIIALDSPLKGMYRFYSNQIPMVMSLILPYSLLLAILWTLSTFSRNCEVTPMLQSGRSLLRVTAPIIAIGLFTSIYTTIFNYQWAPSAQLARRLVLDDVNRTKARQRNAYASLEPIIYRNDEDNRIWSIEQFPPLNKPSDHPFKGIHIEQFYSPGKLDVEYFADEATWDAKNRRWTLWNVLTRKHVKDSNGITPSFQDDGKRKPSLVLPYEETPKLLITPGMKIDMRSVPDLIAHLDGKALNKMDRLKFRTHKYLRFAQGFSPFVLALLAIPGGISFSRRGSLSGIGIALGLSGCMIFGFEFFPSLASSGYLPPFLGAWAPNIIFLLIASFLFYRKLAHRTLSDYFSWLPWKKKS